jgi:hypothetical protein
MLERKYRNNLKEGFEHKIKAYRLQAVVERKLLKQAIDDTKLQQQTVVMRHRIDHNETHQSLEQSRLEVLRVQREDQHRFRRQANLRDKTTLHLSLHEKKAELERLSKQSHDRVVEDEQLVDKKKNYFDYLKRAAIRREEGQLKRQLLQKIMHNTEKLKDLKQTLEQLRDATPDQSAFLTL